jgi:putative Mg2+ transporter-C (MgtC) family protein
MNDLSLLPEMLGALTAAAVFGGVLGLEREVRRRWAGLRTHMLVALGAALFVGAVGFSEPQSADAVARVIQGVAAGVGFIGAGTILKLTEHLEVRGLTTASSVWLAAAVGTACGVRLYVFAAVGTLIGLVILYVLGRLERAVEASTPSGEGDTQTAPGPGREPEHPQAHVRDGA